MTLQVKVTGPQKIGAVPHGTRVTAPIIDGRFEGPLLRGGVLPGETYYFRTTPRFETAEPRYSFLNRLLAVAIGDRQAEGPIYTIYEIL
jgi:hypothetical protein